MNNKGVVKFLYSKEMHKVWDTLKNIFRGGMPSRRGGGGARPLVGVIDDGTRTVRFVVYEAECTNELMSHQLDKALKTPQEGWSEQDPKEILQDIETCVANVLERLPSIGYTKEDIVTLGITNQRESTVCWDKNTGEPLHPTIVWNDNRTDSTVDAILAKIPDRNKNYLKAAAGLPVSPYFSALKMRWLKDNVRAVRRACREKRALFGTVDSWIVWNLTGGPNGGLHITDVTNASRTLLMNIETLHWDSMLCRLFGIHPEFLPDIKSSSEVYGVVKCGSPLDGISISGILGNQQSALVGQMCLQAGQAKNTYREGCFLLYNTGTKRVQSSHGLVTTVAYKMGPKAPTVYALEGSIAVAGGAMKYLRDKLRLIESAAPGAERAAELVANTGDVYFVPAFSGLYAPYWRKDARGIICGLTAFTTKNHIVRAALEAICFQTRDILEAMHKDCQVPLTKLHVDGNMTANNLLMQLQADLIGMPVLRAHTWDMTALGAAMVAGAAVGVWSPEAQRRAVACDTFLPTTTEEERDARYTKWKMAVQRSLGWASTKKSITMTGTSRRSAQGSDLDRRDSRMSNVSDLSVQSESDENPYVEELLQYSARKYSLTVPIKLPKNERTILDDLAYFNSKKECDYGMCKCCSAVKVVSKDWQKIEDIIEHDPEIIFDFDNNPILVESYDANGNIEECEMGKGSEGLRKVPHFFRKLYRRMSMAKTVTVN